ncbi:ABC transporter substrate-binding protein [Methylobacterium terricola]|uniref:ABC transporter substrate-binding protein n=1 Tax=Methylobacterium terricola TaxID=2583531 RepID=A0A5C4L811_9HYPH|nr:ABC transporter substrate-binding protein [Methylobacterium terricola]TNC07167.1 ABC transporter substrate-binding protein [Methylobacterium terricola]
MAVITRREGLLGLVAAGALAGAGPARAQAKKTVSIAIQFGTSHLATTVADKLGLFAKHAKANGIADTAFDVRRVSGSPAINDGIFSGTFDVGAYGPTALLAAWLKTRGSYDLRGIAACNEGVLTLYTNDPAIRSIADIKPSDRIAVTATTSPQAILLRMAAEKLYGPGQSGRFDKQMVALPHPDATTALISKSSISLYFAAPPFISTLEASGKCTRVADGQEIIGGPYSGALLATTGKFASANPAAVATIVAALKEAMDVIRNDPNRVAQIYREVEKTALSADEVAAAVRAQTFTVEPRGIMAFAGFMKRSGELKEAPARWQDVFVGPITQGAGA